VQAIEFLAYYFLLPSRNVSNVAKRSI